MSLMGLMVESRASKIAGEHPSGAGSWLSKLIGGDNAAGVELNEWSALSLSTVWACSTYIATDVAKVPVYLYRRRPKHGRDRVMDHPASKLLLRSPNPSRETTAFAFRRFMELSRLNWGNGYAEIERNRGGRPIALWPLKPWRMTVKRDTASLNPTNRKLVYSYLRDDGITVPMNVDDVLHIRGPGDSVVGYNVIRLARESMAAVMAADRFAATFYGNSAVPKAVLEHPGQLGEQAQKNLKESWDAAHRGVDNAHKLAILEEGAKLHVMTIPPEEAQFLQTRQFNVPEICRWYRMPPHKVGDLSRATFSNIEQQDLQYTGDTLMPAWVTWEQEAWAKLLTEDERNSDELYFEHLVDAALRSDIKTRYTAYNIGRHGGWLSANDILDRENMNPLPGEQGNVYWAPVNIASAADLTKTFPDDLPGVDPDDDPGVDDPDDDDDEENPTRALPIARADAIRGVARAQAPVMEAAIAAVLRVEADKVERSKRSGDAQWATEFYARHLDHVRAAIFPIVDASIAAVRCVAGGAGPASGPLVLDLATRHVTASREQLAADSAAAIRSWRSTRAAQDAAAACELLAEALVRTWPKE